MLLLDTNHYSEAHRASSASTLLLTRLSATDEARAISVLTAEEAVRGWLAEIHRHRDGPRSVHVYHSFQLGMENVGRWVVLPWTESSRACFRDLRALRTRIGPMDLRIACIALAHDATLLTRNVADFRQVPGLRFENWLD